MKKNIKKLNKTNKFVGSSKKKHTVMEKKQKNNKKTVKINRKSIINKVANRFIIHIPYKS